MTAVQKQEWLDVLAAGRQQGVPARRVCAVVGLAPRRVRRWRHRLAGGGGLADDRPGPRAAPHRLLAAERAAILARARLAVHADAASRILAYTALDAGDMAVSPSSVYRVLAATGMTAERGQARRRRPGAAPPLREPLTGPNQRWCWDITSRRTFVPHVFLFLSGMLDEWSRKGVAWLVAEIESFELGKVVTDRALAAEGRLGPAARPPVVINDRGPSMQAKSLRRFFADLGVPQRFARPRTPNDNPFIEAAFRTIKYHPTYPGRFADRAEAETYFAEFFLWYNHQHLHSGIGHVPPARKHTGRDQEILARRTARLAEARSRRLRLNRRASYRQSAEASSPEEP